QACDATLALPVGAGFSSPDARVTLSAPVAAATLYFQPDGTITSDAAGAVPVARTVLTVSAPTLPARTVTLSGTTGYVD
ncbi:MAG: hypothetical protein ACLGI6_17000, partial [Gammaproteobacteria bacterium]